MDASHESSLYQECIGMDFESLYNERLQSKQFRLVRALGAFREAWPMPGCSLCEFVEEIVFRTKLADRRTITYLALLSTHSFNQYRISRERLGDPALGIYAISTTNRVRIS
jgi:hypothetical protein